MTPLSREILEFWFGPPPHAARAEWFRKDPAFDAAIRVRFGDALEAGMVVGLRFDRLLRAPRCASCGPEAQAVPSPWFEAVA